VSRLEEGFAEAIASDKSVMTAAGTPAWLTENDGYWWGTPFYKHYVTQISRDNPPNDVVVFSTREEASRRFEDARRQRNIGPWYYEPSKEFEVIAVKRKYRQIPDGYETVK
jgi:hypothetical protein